MKAVKWCRLILAQGCIISSIVMIAIHILDWYNPFMNFAGHGIVVEYVLCGCALVLGVIDTFWKEKGRKHN